MFLTVDTSITIRARSEAIWDYASRPENWTASNPEEHFGLRFDSADNMPAEGAAFHQKESVAGLYADLRERFHYFDWPNLAFWSGTATYRLLGGVVRVRLHEGGVIKLEKTEGGNRLSHNVFVEFPDTVFGRITRWVFEHRFNGRQAVFDHTYKELVYFKEKLESSGQQEQRGREIAT